MQVPLQVAAVQGRNGIAAAHRAHGTVLQRGVTGHRIVAAQLGLSPPECGILRLGLEQRGYRFITGVGATALQVDDLGLEQCTGLGMGNGVGIVDALQLHRKVTVQKIASPHPKGGAEHHQQQADEFLCVTHEVTPFSSGSQCGKRSRYGRTNAVCAAGA